MEKRINIGVNHDDLPKLGAERNADLTEYLRTLEASKEALERARALICEQIADARYILANASSITDHERVFYTESLIDLSQLLNTLENQLQRLNKEHTRATGEKSAN